MTGTRGWLRKPPPSPFAVQASGLSFTLSVHVRGTESGGGLGKREAVTQQVRDPRKGFGAESRGSFMDHSAATD